MSDPQDPPDIQVVVPPAVQGALKEWLGLHGWYLFLIQGAGNGADTYGIGPDWQPGLVTDAPLSPSVPALPAPAMPAPALAVLPVPRYELHLGIRPASASRGRVRGVVRRVEEGGAVEWWSCQHDHAQGVRNIRDVTPTGREAALRCAEDWLAGQVAGGAMAGLPVIREEE